MSATPVATKEHNSDGQWWQQHCPSLLRSTTVTGNDDNNIVRHYCARRSDGRYWRNQYVHRYCTHNHRSKMEHRSRLQILAEKIIHSNDGRMTLSHPSLLGSTVRTDDFYPSLLCYYCNDIVVTTDMMLMTTDTYDPFLQQCAVVV
jgi:hypothetical protein